MRVTKILFLLFLCDLFLVGCSNSLGVNGLFKDFTQFLSWAIDSLAVLFSNNYGLAIICLTVIIRLVLMPMMIKQHISQTIRKEKMKILQPQIEAVKLKYTKDQIQDNPSLAKERDKEILSLYKENGINPFSVGCLPILIQFSILIGVYYAIKTTPAIATHQFLWLELGKPDFLLSILTGITYLIQLFVSRDQVSSQYVPKYLSYIGFISPIVMVSICLTVPSALPLYWMISGIFLIFQTILVKRILYNIKSREILREQEL